MRQSKKSSKCKVLNKSYHSTKVSFPSMQISPRTHSRPEACVSKAKFNVDFLSKEIKRHQRVHSELKGTMELEKKHGIVLEQKINTFKQQLELVLQQNGKLKTAKNVLIEELQTIIHSKERIEKQKLKAKLAFKQQASNLHKMKKTILKDYMKQMKELADRIQREKETRLALIQNLKYTKDNSRTLISYKSSIDNNSMNKEFIKEINTLSHIIKLN